jgi:hypothetical protein
MNRTRSITTHSTGARVSLIFIVNLPVSAVRRARLIRALGFCWTVRHKYCNSKLESASGERLILNADDT